MEHSIASPRRYSNKQHSWRLKSAFRLALVIPMLSRWSHGLFFPQSSLLKRLPLGLRSLSRCTATVKDASDVPAAQVFKGQDHLALAAFPAALRLLAKLADEAFGEDGPKEAARAIPAGPILQRRRRWELFLQKGGAGDSACLIAVRRASALSAEDASTAMAAAEEEMRAAGVDPRRSALIVASTALSFRALTALNPRGGCPFAFVAGARLADLTRVRRMGQLESWLGDRAKASQHPLPPEQMLSASPSVSLAGDADSDAASCVALQDITSPSPPALYLPHPLLPPPGSLPTEPRPWREERERLVGTRAPFDLQAPFAPSGDQPAAIASLIEGLAAGKRRQTLLGATGTGKTYMIANVLAAAGRPTLVLAPNKVLAAQLCNELRALFPNNAVEYFVSYYDYYLPEHFMPATDRYVEKVVQINEDIDRMRHSATQSLFERRDVIVVASVSCIYGLGMPAAYMDTALRVEEGQQWGASRSPAACLAATLEQMLCYRPANTAAEFRASPRGAFFVRQTGVGSAAGGSDHGIGGGGDDGAVLEIGPAADDHVLRVTLTGDGVISCVEVVTGGDDTGADDMPPAARSLCIKNLVDGGVTASDTESAARAAAGTVGTAAEVAGKEAVGAQLLTEPTADRVVAAAADAKALSPSLSSQPPGSAVIYPAKHHVVKAAEREVVLRAIEREMEERCAELAAAGMALEARRLQQRCENDLFMMRAIGTCKGVENYSRHLARREAGAPPETLLDYFPAGDWLLVIDESHVTVPQVRAMYGGDRARKMNLVKHGFRLPSALDNRPLQEEEFWNKVGQCIFVSATPSRFEIESSASPGAFQAAATAATAASAAAADAAATATTANDDGSGGGSRSTAARNARRVRSVGRVSSSATGSLGLAWNDVGLLVDAQAVIRPTGIADPPVHVRPSAGQMEDLVSEAKMRVMRGEKVLVTALTKRMAEDLCNFLVQNGLRSQFLHSEVKPMRRLELLRELRSGATDVLVGVNLLREGLNLPEVSLVCVLDADKEGFLRSDTALIQTIGRATRHERGEVILYAGRITGSMRRALDETSRRRDIQLLHNRRHGIVPSTATSAAIGDSLLVSIAAAGGGGRGSGRSSSSGSSDVGGEGLATVASQSQWLYDLVSGASDSVDDSGDDSRGESHGGGGSGGGERGRPAAAELGLPVDAAVLRLLETNLERAAENMVAAAAATEYYEAAVWRDRRNAIRWRLDKLRMDAAAAAEGAAAMEAAGGLAETAAIRASFVG